MYGDNSGQLREALGTLLREHRIQQRLGGKGTHTVPETTTVEEREELGEQIRRYRECVLTWCLQAVGAASPRINSLGTTARSRAPAEELHYRLTEALAASTAGLARSEELVAEQQFATVESWRQAARGAALGEHDFGAGVSYALLSDDQCMTVLKDAADIVRGLVALDRRYDGVPGWEKLKNQGRLGRAAETCAAHAGYNEPDYTVDLRGWRPAPRLVAGPPMPGLAGVMQAHYNLLLHLEDLPDAHSLRVVMDSQRVVSREASLRIGDVEPQLAARWTARSATYARVVKQTRDLGGIVGTGQAAGQAAIAASRSQRLDRAPLSDTKELRQLDRLFAHIDARVCAVVEHGAKERLYYVRVPLPRVDDRSPGIVKGQRQRFAPITSPVQTDLLAIVRHELRPEPLGVHPPGGAVQKRADFEAAIVHRPGEPGPALSL